MPLEDIVKFLAMSSGYPKTGALFISVMSRGYRSSPTIRVVEA